MAFVLKLCSLQSVLGLIATCTLRMCSCAASENIECDVRRPLRHFLSELHPGYGLCALHVISESAFFAAGCQPSSSACSFPHLGGTAPGFWNRSAQCSPKLLQLWACSVSPRILAQVLPPCAPCLPLSCHNSHNHTVGGDSKVLAVRKEGS